MYYIFHGDDTHSQKETLDGLLAKLGDPGMLDLNTSRFDGAVDFVALQQVCGSMPFLAKARIVIVKDLLATKMDKAYVKQLLAFLPDLPETTRLFFLESAELPGNHAVLKAAETAVNGYVKLFSRPEGVGLERWIRQRVAEKNGRISPHAAQLLAANIGNDLQILDNEIEKLVLYAGADEIKSDDVEKLCPYLAEANIFDLVDAIGNRNGRKAATLLQQKFNEGTDPFYLFSMFVRQFRLLLQVKELADAGERPPAIAKTLKMHSFVVGKIHQQTRGFSITQLEQIYRHLLDIDVGVKTGRNDMTTALNVLVASLTADESP
ncbi:MAG: DNA polymerase III subunit delta [Chloroflexota bacterium]|nr:DNA polymerase III subunit delta [Anaerolineales bacterium]MCB8966996.1 DNA polymerase III subunit delta [Ardenticatenaceae bacterium]